MLPIPPVLSASPERIATDKHSEKCSIVIDPNADRAGLLHDLLGVFAKRRINLTRIESRPSKRGMGNYVFFLDYACVSGYKRSSR